MHARRRAVCFVGAQLLASLIAVQVVNAQEDSAPWWNPFASQSQPADGSVRQSSYFNASDQGATKSEESKSSFSLPKLPWSGESKPKNTGPSTWDRMGSSTKKFWHSTVDFMNPFDDSPKPSPSKSNGYRPQSQTTTTTSGTGMFGWLWREEKTESPSTVNDFLRQPRPQW
jgi:hypothetical protein